MYKYEQKIVTEGKSYTKSVVLKSVCALASRYFCYSVEAKRVKATGTGSDRKFTGMFTCVLKFFTI